MSPIRIDPARLESGSWNMQTQAREGEGDIASAYSADRIAEGQPIRKPFVWNGNLMVTTAGGPGPKWEAYQLVPVKAYSGATTTYADLDYEAARNNPLGFYHGLTVKSGRETYVMVGPEVEFVGDPKLAERKAEQINLL